jgi:tetratricopeptide (TPR) repeat protein
MPEPVVKRLCGWRLLCLRLLLAIATPVLFFGLFEVGLRIAHSGYSSDFFVAADADGDHVTNPRFGWRFFPRTLARIPHPHRMTPKVDDTVRIYILGGSAAMGTPDATFGFGRMLEVMLREQYPTIRFEVVNAAMTAINSYVVREIAQDCAAHDPDLFVVYMGNNEVIGPYGPGTVFQHWNPSLAMIRFSLGVKASRVGQFAGGHMEAFSGGKEGPVTWKGLEMFRRNLISADDERLDIVYRNFRENISDICSAAQKADADVILSTVAVNLRDFPPLVSVHKPDLGAEDLATWQTLYEEGISLASSNHWGEAVARYEAATKIDDRYAELQFRLAESLLEMDKPEAARERFELARDLDALRFRADSQLNTIVREVAERSDSVELVDVEHILAKASPDGRGIVGEDFFYEHVHLNIPGNYQLAKAVFEQVVATVPQLADATREGGQFSSQQDCMDALVLTAWDEYQLALKMVGLTSVPPFTEQLDYARRQGAAAQQRDELQRSASTPQAKQGIWESYERAIAKDPDNWRVRYRFAQLASLWGRPQVAVDHFEYVLSVFPLDAAKRSEMGLVLAELGRFSDAAHHCKEALIQMPDSNAALTSYASVLFRSGQTEKALTEYQKAYERDPNDELVHNNIGSALYTLERVDEAVTHYRRAIEIKPSYAEAHKNLGIVLTDQGKADEAIAHFEIALESEPGQATIHYRLGLLYVGQNRPDEAISHYRQALEFKPDYGSTHNNLAGLLMAKGQTDDAIAHFRAAAKILPNSIDAHLNLGKALSVAGRQEEAVPHFKKAQALKTRHAALQQFRGPAPRTR